APMPNNDNVLRAGALEVKEPQVESLLDSETCEPLLFSESSGEIDVSAWPGLVDHRTPKGGIPACSELELTEDSIARAFVDRYGWELRYDHDRCSWYIWDGTHWRQDETRAA